MKPTKRTTSTSKKIKILNIFKKYPLSIFIVSLVLLLIILGTLNYLREEEMTVENIEIKPIEVDFYAIGSAPIISTNAKIEKSGSITIFAQSPGIVDKILVKPGQDLNARQAVARMSNNYYGGNSAYLQLQIAQLQEENIIDTFDTQMELIAKQKETARKQETSSSELRDISRRTLEDSKNLLKLNEEIIQTLDDRLKTASDSAIIFQTKQLKSQLLQGTVQLRSQINQTEYQSDDEKSPAELSRLQKDAVLLQLQMQEKSLALNKEVIKLQTSIARVQAAMMSPATLFSSRVERIHVKEGQFANAGTPLVTVSSDQKTSKAIALVTPKIAKSINIHEPSTIRINGADFQLFPDYISSEPTDGQMHSIQFTLEPQISNLLSNNGFMRIDIPIGSADTSSTVPFIPIDAVRQTETEASVLVIQDDIATARLVELGAVMGSFVEIKSGLNNKDKVILQRNVLAGQKVTQR